MTRVFHTVIVIILILANMEGMAQNQSHIDSLMTRLEEPNLSQKTEIRVLNQLAWEYKDFQPETAIEFGKKAIKLAKKLNDASGLAEAYKIVGVSYGQTKQYMTALTFLFQALALEEGLNNDKGRAECLNYIGQFYKGRGNYSEAIRYYIKAVELYEKMGNKKGTLNALNNISDTYYKQARYNNALKFSYKSIAIAVEIGAEEEYKEACFTLSQVYARIGNYKKAYDFYRIYTDIKDSLYKEARILELKKKETEFEQKQTALKQAEIEKERKHNSRNIQYLLISLLFIALFSSLFFIGNYFAIPPQIIKILIFTSLFLTSQFLLLLIRPYIEEYTGGLPVVMLILNASLAFSFLMLHRVIETKLKNRVMKPLEERTERIRAKQQSEERRKELSTANDSKIVKQ